MLPEPAGSSTVVCMAGRLSCAPRAGREAGGTAQAGWGSHRLRTQEVLPLHRHFLTVTCGFPKICHQKAPLSSPRGPEPAPAPQLRSLPYPGAGLCGSISHGGPQAWGNPRVGWRWTSASHWESARVPCKAPLKWQRTSILLLLRPQLRAERPGGTQRLQVINLTARRQRCTPEYFCPQQGHP